MADRLVYPGARDEPVPAWHVAQDASYRALPATEVPGAPRLNIGSAIAGSGSYDAEGPFSGQAVTTRTKAREHNRTERSGFMVCLLIRLKRPRPGHRTITKSNVSFYL
jgi:hypothetical protein